MLLLSLIIEHVSLPHRTFTINHDELLLCFRVGLKYLALPGIDLGIDFPDGMDSKLERVSQDVLAELKTLANIIQSSIDNMETVVNDNAFVLPSSNAPFSLQSETPRMHPSIQSAGSLITSAAAQLMTLVRPAPLVVLDAVMQVNLGHSCGYLTLQ